MYSWMNYNLNCHYYFYKFALCFVEITFQYRAARKHDNFIATVIIYRRIF